MAEPEWRLKALQRPSKRRLMQLAAAGGLAAYLWCVLLEDCQCRLSEQADQRSLHAALQLLLPSHLQETSTVLPASQPLCPPGAAALPSPASALQVGYGWVCWSSSCSICQYYETHLMFLLQANSLGCKQAPADSALRCALGWSQMSPQPACGSPHLAARTEAQLSVLLYSSS